MFWFTVADWLTLTSSGSVMYCPTMRRISRGIVAENSHVHLSSGVKDKISSNSSLKPMFNISSASSSTRCRMRSSFTALRLARSMRRPGVAITTWQGFFNCAIWVAMLAPP